MHVIAIDGPSASGKSTTARQVAEALGLVHLNSGLLYRGITWLALRDDWASPEDVSRGLAAGRIELDPDPPAYALRIDGRPAGDWLQSRAVNARVSDISAIPAVRDHVLTLLREATRDLDLVVDGRDIGTVVFPDADLKIFLTAAAHERARRRLAERRDETGRTTVSEEASRLAERDRLDATRSLAPLARAEDAIEVDSTSLAPADVVARIVELYRARVPKVG